MASQNEPEKNHDDQSSIDWILFGFAILLIVVVCVPLFLFPEKSGKYVESVYTSISNNLGILYQWGSIAVVVLLGWIAVGRYGNVRLGNKDDKPEFSLFNWVSMLFCAGIGSGVMYWATIEWANYIETPPHGAEPRSVEAITWAASYGLFHWGPTAWCLYCLPTLAIAVPYYRRNLSTLRLSVILHSILPKHHDQSWQARTVDFLFMMALVGGSGTSLGLATPMIANAIAKLAGIQPSFKLEVVVLFFCVLVFATSVYLGLRRGIQALSNLNVVMLLMLCMYVVVAGPTLFILRMSTDSIGFTFQNVLRMMTWTDPVNRTGFIENYTVFYWAWWIAYAPFFGLFVARISRGRTVREVILGMAVFGTLGCALLYSTFGNYGLHLELTEQLPVTQIMNEQGAPTAISEIVYSLPLGGLVLGVFALCAIIFTATTYDSASYALASAATRRLGAGAHPARAHRVFWAFGLAILPIAVMFLDKFNAEASQESSLKIIQSCTLVVSLPILFLGIIMAWSLLRELRASVDEHDSCNEKT